MSEEGRTRRKKRPSKQPKGEGERPVRSLLVLGLIFTVGLLALLLAGIGPAELDPIAFKRLLLKGEVEEVTFKAENEALVVLRPGDMKGDAGPRDRVVRFLDSKDATAMKDEITSLALSNTIATKIKPVRQPNALLSPLAFEAVLIAVVLGVLYWFVVRPMRSQGGPGNVLNFGKSRHRIASRDKTGITLEDVAGCDEAKDEIREIIEFLKNPKKFSRLGGRIPKGVMLIGAPGTGKTLLAKAAAGEADVPFFSVCGSDFVEMFVGVGASRVRDLFEKAKENSPCILFLDEVDAVGRRRGSGLGGGHDEREQTLNQILVEMDGFDTDKGIIVVAATNRPDILDPALLRPGRFDRQIVLDLPDVKGREQILLVHSRNVKLGPDVDLRRLAQATIGFSGAELEAVINEAALHAALSDKTGIDRGDLDEARDKVQWGRQKRSRVMDVEDRRATAYHEAGHALVAVKHEASQLLHKVTIVPRGMALGLTMSIPERDRTDMKKKEAAARVAMCFGGRLGERVATNDIATGASNDIEQATNLARRMVCEWGMSDELGPINYSPEKDTVFLGREITRTQTHSEETARMIDIEVRKVVDLAYARAQEIIAKHRDCLDKIAEALLKYETITGEEVVALVGGTSVLDLRPEPAPAPLPAPAREPVPEPERERRPEIGGNSAPIGAIA
ncbi:ATP-dependent zinc metalloprotease FtsH [bacterium]|nr:ATP-dependent zinc metalloprotease FtsH [bacterium]